MLRFKRKMRLQRLLHPLNLNVFKTAVDLIPVLRLVYSTVFNKQKVKWPIKADNNGNFRYLLKFRV